MDKFELHISRRCQVQQHVEQRLIFPMPKSVIEDVIDALGLNQQGDCYVFPVGTVWNEIGIKMPEQSTCSLVLLRELIDKVYPMEKWEAESFRTMAGRKSVDYGGCLPLYEYLNIAENVNRSLIISNVFNDSQLGECLINRHLNEIDDEFLSGIRANIDLEGVGRDYRRATDGIYTEKGLVLLSSGEGKYSSNYIPEPLEWKGEILIQIKNTDLKTALIWLPATEKEIKRRLTESGIVSIENCKLTIEEIKTPGMVGVLYDNFYDTGNLEEINQYAEKVSMIEQIGELKLFKAVLEISGCDSVSEALSLAETLNEYELDMDIHSAEQYTERLLENYPEINNDLREDLDFQTFGEVMMIINNKGLSCYGVLSKKDGGEMLFDEYVETELSGAELEMKV